MENYARDLLKGFNMSAGVGVRGVNVSMREENDERVELNLGLSLGGRFGVNKDAKKKKLLRSSSVLGTMPLLRDRAAVAPPLMRTASLPAEGEEELRRRKEMQTQRRMVARRRRSEKQRGGSGAGASGDEAVVAGSVAIGGLNRFGSSAAVTVAVPPPGWRELAVTKQAVLGRGRGFQGLFGKPSAQGLGDSPGGSSSSLSAEMDSKAILGPIRRGEAKSPVVNQSTQVRGSHNAAGSGGKTNEIVAARTPKAEVENPSSPIGTNSMEHKMPCVYTTGNGPNGRRIEGILYKYGNGEEVRIMCVCHGTFMSPAEFVKHAGGGDVEYPLRHIVVSASTNPFL